MKKSDAFFIIIDVLFLIDAIIDICSGVGTSWDFGVLFFAIVILGAFIVRGIMTEIKIQKKLKQMREEEQNHSVHD